MKFRYKQFGLSFYRPVIPVQISYKKKAIKYAVLIDSGADFCLFNYDVAKFLGISVEDGEKSEAHGITQGGSPVFIHTITLKVGNSSMKVKAGFLKNMTNAGFGVVGHFGFFDKFEIRFDYQNKTIELIPKKKKPRYNLFWSTFQKRIS